jgi:hypothetical protein
MGFRAHIAGMQEKCTLFDIDTNSMAYAQQAMEPCKALDIACASIQRPRSAVLPTKRKKPPPEGRPYLVLSKLVNGQTAFSDLLSTTILHSFSFHVKLQ